jgi:site-specific DNA recombinase
MIAAIYARKSNEQTDVADDAKSVTRQVDGAKSFITSKGWTLADHHVYVDDGVSGALFANRREFQRLMRDAAAGAFQAIVFYDLDRFGRNANKTMVALNTLADLGVSIWDYSTGLAVDLDSFEGEMMTFMKARFAQQYRDQVRKHTTSAMRQKAEQGLVTGGKVFGYDNVRLAKGQTTRTVNTAEAAVVRDIYTRYADGAGLRTIALGLNRTKALSPRAQLGRPNGWSSTSVREVLQRPIYRGELVYGRTQKAYGRELLGVSRTKEKGQIAKPEETWTRRDVPALRIVDVDLAARVDARRAEHRRTFLASKTNGRAREKAHGKYLLTGGMLVCPVCQGHFEVLRKDRLVYVCSTRRRKPGTCTNGVVLPMVDTDETVLDMVDGEVLGQSFIDELLMLVDKGEADDSARLLAERDRLQTEMNNLLDLAASGVSASTLAPKIKERETVLAQLDKQLRAPRQAPVNVAQLRDALTQRADQWRADLRGAPDVARLVLRRLIGPLLMFEPAPDYIPFNASVREGLLDGLVPGQPVHHGTSPAGFEPAFWP